MAPREQQLPKFYLELLKLWLYKWRVDNNIY